MAKDFDASEVLKGSVDAVSVRLANLTDAELTALHDVEHKGAGRVTLLGAIDREVDARIERAKAEGGVDAARDVAADAPAANDTAYVAPPGTPTPASPAPAVDEVQRLQAELAAMTADRDRASDAVGGVQRERDALKDRVDELEGVLAERTGADSSGAPLYGQAEVDKLLADQRAALEADRDRQVADAVAAAAAKPRPKAKGAKAIELAAGDAGSLAAVREQASQVVLVDSDDVPIAELTPLAFDPASYRAEAGRVVLDRPIAPPATMPRREVAAAFVLVDGKALGKAVLVSPFAIGGGRSTSLPAGTLSFERTAPPSPSAALAA